MRKNKLIFAELLIAFILICTSVYATVTATIGVTSSKETVKPGEEITVTLSLKNVDSSKKVESIEGYINYDEDVIEDITVDSIEKDSDNTVTIGNQKLKVEDLTNANPNSLPSTTSYVAFNGNPSSGNDSKIVIDLENGISDNVDLLKIKFKVKQNADIGEVENAITYSMFVITAGSEQSQEITEQVRLKIEKESSANENTNNENKNTTNTNSNTNKNNNTNSTNENKNTSNQNTNTNKNNSNTNTNSNSTNTNTNTNNNNNATSIKSNFTNSADNTSKSVLPSTGARMLILPVFALIILSFICYNRYMKYKGI